MTERAPEARPVLEATGLGKRYGGRAWALRDVDLAIPRGTVTALVGPNGAGKSTLMRAWVAFERPTAGRVAVLGIDPWRRRFDALEHVGYVPQTPALYRELTVDEHLDLAATVRRGFDRLYAVQRLEQLGIALTSKGNELSGGQAAQVGLALALGTRADVLLLDEPLASLDPLARREFLRVVTDSIHRDGTTAVLSSHIVTDVRQACDRLIVLGGGRKLLDDSIEHALTAHRIVAGAAIPSDPSTVASFLGETGDRLTLVRADEGARLDPSIRPATLEELVMGYLSFGREPTPGSVGRAA